MRTRWPLVVLAIALLGLAPLFLLHPAPAASAPASASTAVSPLASATPLDRQPHAAEVREVIQVRGYTYLRLHLLDPSDDISAVNEEVWAVSFAASLSPGQRIQVRPFAERTAFASRQLGRTFARLWFVTVSPLHEDTTG